MKYRCEIILHGGYALRSDAEEMTPDELATARQAIQDVLEAGTDRGGYLTVDQDGGWATAPLRNIIYVGWHPVEEAS
jgi:isoaspartyl peptidase/L-asparaginase-like protein (Ntn-hydrolase superfamily)